jgi:hypothetical protein
MTERVSWIIAGLASMVTAILVWHYQRNYNKLERKQEQTKVESNAMKEGVRALLKDRIIQSYNYHCEKGYCLVHDRDAIEDMYVQYKNLGGNGNVEDLMIKLRHLPTSPPKRKGAINE